MQSDGFQAKKAMRPLASRQWEEEKESTISLLMTSVIPVTGGKGQKEWLVIGHNIGQLRMGNMSISIIQMKKLRLGVEHISHSFHYVCSRVWIQTLILNLITSHLLTLPLVSS